MVVKALRNEANLPAFRPVVHVQWMRRGKRRSWRGWALFIGFIVLNETRGLYVVAEFLKAYNG